MNRLMYLWFAVKTVFCTCQSDHRVNNVEKVRSQYKISKIGKLPGVINESSGLARGKSAGTFWTHNDSGGKPELYEFDLSGRLRSTKSVPNATNRDWEEIGQDNDGHIFIGDIGNNAAPRDQFQIYRFDLANNRTDTINFRYKGFTAPPAKGEEVVYDSEAFFYFDQHLYLFSKNHGKNKFVKLYRIPAEPGNYTTAASDSIQINAQVTAADVSPDGRMFALLTYGKILVFDVSEGKIDFSRPKGCFRFVKKQTEALVFINNSDMLVTNEQGDIYRITYR